MSDPTITNERNTMTITENLTSEQPVPTWLNLDSIVPPDLVTQGREAAADIRHAFAELAPTLKAAKELHARIDALVNDFTDAGPIADIVYELAGGDDLFNALRGAANEIDPEGPR